MIWKAVLLGVLAAGAGLAWGLAAGVYHVFPYQQVRAVQDAVMSALPIAERNRAYRNSETTMARGMAMADWDTQAQIVMIGDSITELAPWKDMFPDADILNRGASGDTVGGVEQRLDLILRAEPEHAFVMIGTNDLNLLNDPEDVIAIYRRVVDRLMATGAQVYLQSLPLCGETFKHCSPDRRAQERALNDGIERLATETGANFIDLAPAYPRGAEFRPDGVHPNTTGYKAWRDILAPHIPPAAE